MTRDARVFLADILESIERIETYTRSLGRAQFLKDVQAQDAVLRRLEVIGEAVKNIPKDVRDEHPDVRWAEIAGLRDVLIHGYFRVNLERVWLVVEDDVPILKAQVNRILETLNSSG